jgi:hypothetical protein
MHLADLLSGFLWRLLAWRGVFECFEDILDPELLA